MKLVKQGDEEQFNKETKLFHFEFTSNCNQHCSYCLEGNCDLNKPIVNFSKKDDLLNTLDKIFEAYDENVMLGFILVGGEPTIQPYFIDVVNKIKNRKNAFQVLTTNFTQTVEYYKELDIPLVTSLHLDSHNPDEWLEKTLQLKELIAHTRIMANPEKMDKVRQAYNLFSETSKKYPLSFAVEKVFGFSIVINGKKINYTPNYKEEDLEFIQNCTPIDAPYPNSLDAKMGCLKNIFYRSQWFYRDDKGQEIIKIDDVKQNNFKGFFCELSMIIIRADGDLFIGCNSYNLHNIYNEQKFPKDEVKTVVCKKDCCSWGLNNTIPKYSSIEYAPVYKNKTDLLKTKTFLDLLAIRFPKKIIFKIMVRLIFDETKRKKFRNKYF